MNAPSLYFAEFGTRMPQQSQLWRQMWRLGVRYSQSGSCGLGHAERDFPLSSAADARLGSVGDLSKFLSRYPLNAGMLDNEKLQLAGPIGIIGAISCAELGAHALATWPTSSFLWYLNLEVFRFFQYSLNGLGVTARFGAFGLTIWIAISLLMLICTGLIAKIKLPLAIASNLSLIYSACLLYGSYAANEAATSPGFNLSGLWCPSTILAATILLVSFLSSSISHRSYWREIFA
jgi:hypothetical protein